MRRSPALFAGLALAALTLQAWQTAAQTGRLTIAAQSAPDTAPAYVAIYETGRWFPSLAALGPGIVYDRQAQQITLAPQPAAPLPVISVSDEVFTGAQIGAAVPDAGGNQAASITTPQPPGLAAYFVASQAHLYPRITWSRFAAGETGFALSPENRIHFRPYDDRQGTVRVLSLTLTQPAP